jgi:hypothetical protein
MERQNQNRGTEIGTRSRSRLATGSRQGEFLQIFAPAKENPGGAEELKTKTVFEISVGRIFPIEAFDDDRWKLFVGVWAGDLTSMQFSSSHNSPSLSTKAMYGATPASVANERNGLMC